ncbi:hypothetical protein OQJ26_10150 [Legionella sp. PATHC038]|uniref:hypothetical protein n=1 Tax=Legionella sheltonii TaxID=2992041 RepID=UPI002243174F|nr:hypothetical protein [Legionella sp. PATHC038]MCW8399153.1 hypothetical protein [Legionella sp. PATHC038]
MYKIITQSTHLDQLIEHQAQIAINQTKFNAMNHPKKMQSLIIQIQFLMKQVHQCIYLQSTNNSLIIVFALMSEVN